MRAIRDKFRGLSAPIRKLPDFLIVGAQKCGTTSLYKYLSAHPSIVPFVPVGHARKEVRYFSNYFACGLNWYKAHFPSLAYNKIIKGLTQRDLITGESSPSYMFHPHAPGRIHELLPDIRLIVLLRNPIDRAYSHYQHVVRLGREELEFERAIEIESDRLAGERDKMLTDERYVSFERGYHSYLTRGLYADQLEALFRLFPREQVLILNSERFFANPGVEFRKVLNFLDVPAWDSSSYEEYNAGAYQDMPAEIRARLAEYFRAPNQRLYELIGEEYAWH